MAKICVFTADGFEEIEGLTVVDLLRRAGAEVLMVSVGEGLTVKGAHNIELKADALFDEVCYAVSYTHLDVYKRQQGTQYPQMQWRWFPAWIQKRYRQCYK